MQNDDLEFDSNKNEINKLKHDNIDFLEADSVLDDPYALHKVDYGDYDEERYFSIGISNQYRILVINWTIRNNKNRIISARLATANQRKEYAKRKNRR